MFRWYQEAAFCIAFLYDVKTACDKPMESLKHSEWFKRGWTLQELLALALVLFIDKDWVALGHKAPDEPKVFKVLIEHCGLSTPAINQELAAITGVRSNVLGDYGKAADVSIEEKQDWMLHRTTTRVEDMAYCQLGIFGVFMHLTYGEGELAMARLRKKAARAERERRQDPLADVDELAGRLSRMTESMKGIARGEEVQKLKEDLKAVRKSLADVTRIAPQLSSTYAAPSQSYPASMPFPQYTGRGRDPSTEPQMTQRWTPHTQADLHHAPDSVSRSYGHPRYRGYAWADGDDEDDDDAPAQTYDSAIRAQQIRLVAPGTSAQHHDPVRPRQPRMGEVYSSPLGPGGRPRQSPSASSVLQPGRASSQMELTGDYWGSGTTSGTRNTGHRFESPRSPTYRPHAAQNFTGSIAVEALPGEADRERITILTRASDLARAKQQAAERGWYLDESSGKWYRYDASNDELV